MIATWHGGRTDSTNTCPGLTALNQAPVTPLTREASPLGMRSSAPPLASGGSHRWESPLRRSTATVSPTRTQKVFPLSAWVMADAPPWHPADPADPADPPAPAGVAECRAGCADGAWT